MLVILLFFLSNAFADDYSVEKYCFQSQVRSSLVHKKITPILLPSDSVTSDENCLLIKMLSNRRELIQRFIYSTDPQVKIEFSSEDIRREPCLLQIEKIRNKTSNTVGLNVDQAGIAEATNSSNVEREIAQIQTVKDFELTVDQNQVKGTCRFISSNRYEISLEVKRSPRQIIPQNLPAGTVVVVNNPPQDESTLTLQTQIQLNRGQKIEVGEIIKDTQNKNHKIDLEPSADVNLNESKNSEKVYLSLQ
jgi:hypothetical protein